MTKVHEEKPNYVVDTITKNEPKAKNIQNKTTPNGDITFMFTVGRKKHEISLSNTEYELDTITERQPYLDALQPYYEELNEATKEIREKYQETIEESTGHISRITEEYTVAKINNYFLNN